MNKWLKGNGYWCPTCQGRGGGPVTDWMEYRDGTFAAFRAPCPTCNGARRLAATIDQIITATVPATPDPAEVTCFTNMIEYGRLTKTGRLPRNVRRTRHAED